LVRAPDELFAGLRIHGLELPIQHRLAHAIVANDIVESLSSGGQVVDRIFAAIELFVFIVLLL